VVAILLVTICSSLLALINIGNPAAFNGTISLTLEGFYISYFLAIGLLLWRRLRGDVHESSLSTQTSFRSDEPFEHHLNWGPWRLKGALGVANNILACCYLFVLILFSFFPSTVAVTGDPSKMNWAVLVTGFVVLFSVGYYLIWAKKTYTGPIVEIDVHAVREYYE
jgi:hypothetical protein